MIETQEISERVILVAVRRSDREDAEASLEELSELVKTAGAACVAKVIQNLEHFHPATYVGKGKVKEIAELAEETGATGIVCDDQLTPAQTANLWDALQIKIMDRTLLILDIFAASAHTSEGKIQVELAQLRYRASRLSGLGTSLSRLGGGIGTRGPGETKLETDRRTIHERIEQLKYELKSVETHRELTRNQRRKTGVPVAAIVGYTNAGKSTLLNALTDADILAEDKLFATLDPTTRSLTLKEGQQLLLTDTVGFINKLPHHLIEAFQSTLEEAAYADVIIHVVDASNPNAQTQMQVVYETLKRLGVYNKPVITAWNKTDVAIEPILQDEKAEKTVRISAKEKTGLEDLKAALEEILCSRKIYLEHVYGYEEAGEISRIRKYGQLLSEEYRAEGIAVTAYVPVELYEKIKETIRRKP